MSKARWSNAELLTLGDLYREGKSYNEIAVKLKRTKRAVAYAVNAYRDVINIDYRQKGSGRKPETLYAPTRVDESEIVTVALTEPKKSWWKIW